MNDKILLTITTASMYVVFLYLSYLFLAPYVIVRFGGEPLTVTNLTILKHVT